MAKSKVAVLKVKPETVLKDMQSGAQETMDRGSVVHAVLRGLRELG